MKALKIVLIVLLSLVAIALIYLSRLDGSYKVTRSIEIDHPAEKVTAHIANLESWAEWSYWNLMDSTNEMSFGDIRSGEGATYTWTGMETGQGEVEVLEVTEDGTVKTMISFIEPMESQMNSDFIVTSEGGKTKISWENYGELPFMFRWMVGGMDNAFGGQLETGLDSLKTQLERMNNNMEGKVNYIEETEIEAVPYYYIRHDIAMSEFTSELMAESYGAIGEHLAEDMQNMTGPPFNLTEEWNRETQRTIFRVAIPANSSKGETDRIKKDMRYGGRVVMAEYQGPYEGIEPAYMGLEEYVEANGLETAGYPFEVYITDPGMEPDPSKWITEVYWPVQ